MNGNLKKLRRTNDMYIESATVTDHTDSKDCWCSPEAAQPCPVCLASDDREDCLYCDRLGYVEPYTDNIKVLYVHR